MGNVNKALIQMQKRTSTSHPPQRSPATRYCHLNQPGIQVQTFPFFFHGSLIRTCQVIAVSQVGGSSEISDSFMKSFCSASCRRQSSRWTLVRWVYKISHSVGSTFLHNGRLRSDLTPGPNQEYMYYIHKNWPFLDASSEI